MKITPTSLTVSQLLGSQNEQYVIPAYQRRYSWKRHQVEDLWDDLEVLESADSHLFGTIVCLAGHHTAGINRLELVDGQQRLTTISILLHCLLDRLKAENEHTEAQDLGRLLEAKALGGHLRRRVTKSEVVDEFQKSFMREVREADALPERSHYSDRDEDDNDDEVEDLVDSGEEVDAENGDDEEGEALSAVRVSFTDFLDGLVKRAGIYRQLVLAATGIPALDRRLRNLRLIRARPSYGFLMSLRAGGWPRRTCCCRAASIRSKSGELLHDLSAAGKRLAIVRCDADRGSDARRGGRRGAADAGPQPRNLGDGSQGIRTMSNQAPTLKELFEDGRAIDVALREAARDARRLHKALGNPMATWKNG